MNPENWSEEEKTHLLHLVDCIKLRAEASRYICAEENADDSDDGEATAGVLVPV